MCGFAFLWHKGKLNEDCSALVSAAIQSLSHRGPDDSQVMEGGGWALGHARLSVVDLNASRQPMKSPDGRYFLAFNGEIYNYQLLRKHLHQYWHFTTSGDTEVLLAGLILEGPDFVRKISGMWAFALFDSTEHRLLLSRDRFGEKPLYYISRPDYFALASELPAMKHIVSEGGLTEDSFNSLYFFRHGFFPPGKTVYQNVKEVLPAHTIEVQLSSATIASQRYWSLTADRQSLSRREAEERLNTLLEQSIRSRLVADVEVGLLLSGGIDSSLLLAKMASEYSPKTFTVGFTSSSYDESVDAGKVADYFNVINIKKVVDQFDPSSIQPLLRDVIGQPFGDPSILPTKIACELASEQVKVCLGGDGADELFSGYQRYQARLLSVWYNRLPDKLRTSLSRLLGSLPASHSHHSRSLIKKAQLFVRLVEQFGASANSNTPRSLSMDAEYRFFSDAFADVGGESVKVIDGAETDEVMSMMLDDLNVYLPQDILLKSDRASMSQSLELRSPFLDEKLVEFAFSLPRSWHRSGMKGKRMLRSAFAKELPDFVWKKRKQGFSIPLGEWLLGSMGTQLESMLHEGLYPTVVSEGAKQMLEEHRKRRGDYSLALWSFYTYGDWKLNEKH